MILLVVLVLLAVLSKLLLKLGILVNIALLATRSMVVCGETLEITASLTVVVRKRVQNDTLKIIVVIMTILSSWDLYFANHQDQKANRN